jgi:hypothetical protein
MTFSNTPAWTEVHIYSRSQVQSWRTLVRLPTDGHRWCLLYCEIQRRLVRATGRLHLYGDFLSEYMALHTANPHHYCCRVNLQKLQHRPDLVCCMFGCSRYNFIIIFIYRVSQEECAKLRESFPYVKVYRYNPKHLYPKLNGYGDNGQRSLKLWQLLHTYWLPNTY